MGGRGRGERKEWEDREAKQRKSESIPKKL